MMRFAVVGALQCAAYRGSICNFECDTNLLGVFIDSELEEANVGIGRAQNVVARLANNHITICK
jgi:hypothetical protein